MAVITRELADQRWELSCLSNSSSSDVFDFLLEIDRYEEWQPNATFERRRDGDVEVGFRYKKICRRREEESFWKRLSGPEKLECKVTRLEPPSRIVWEETSSQGENGTTDTYDLRVEPDGSGSRIVMLYALMPALDSDKINRRMSKAFLEHPPHGLRKKFLEATSGKTIEETREEMQTGTFSFNEHLLGGRLLGGVGKDIRKGTEREILERQSMMRNLEATLARGAANR